MSARRRGEQAIYSKKRAEFLKQFRWCACSKKLFGYDQLATEVHHKAGRVGKNYLDESTWLPVCRDSHNWIHSHPSQAREKGWLA